MRIMFLDFTYRGKYHHSYPVDIDMVDRDIENLPWDQIQAAALESLERGDVEVAEKELYVFCQIFGGISGASIYGALRRADIFSIDDLLAADMDRLKNIRGLGEKRLEIVQKMREYADTPTIMGEQMVAAGEDDATIQKATGLSQYKINELKKEHYEWIRQKAGYDMQTFIAERRAKDTLEGADVDARRLYYGCRQYGGAEWTKVYNLIRNAGISTMTELLKAGMRTLYNAVGDYLPRALYIIGSEQSVRSRITEMIDDGKSDGEIAEDTGEPLDFVAIVRENYDSMKDINMDFVNADIKRLYDDCEEFGAPRGYELWKALQNAGVYTVSNLLDIAENERQKLFQMEQRVLGCTKTLGQIVGYESAEREIVAKMIEQNETDEYIIEKTGQPLAIVQEFKKRAHEKGLDEDE